MMRTLALSALAAALIGAAGIAGAASAPAAGAAPAGPPGMGMMGHRPFGGGMMGFGGGPMMDMHFACGGHEWRKGGKDKDAKPKGPPEIKKADLDACFTKIFAEMDTNHDGKVTLVELQAWRETQKQKREEAAFKRIDKNGDGAVTKDELFGRQLAHFDEVDTNHDGVISPDEMKAFREKMREKMKDHRPPMAPGAPPAQ